MATYRHGTRRIEVIDGEVAKIDREHTALHSYKRLPKRFRAEVTKVVSPVRHSPP